MTDKIHVTFIAVAFLHLVYYIDGLKIFPDVAELIIGKESTLMLNCTSDEPIKWSYPEGITTNVENKNTEHWIVNGTHFNALTIGPAHYLDTGYYICRAVNNTRKKARIYVYVFDENKGVASDDLTIHSFMYERIIIPCKPTSPNISVSLTRHNMKVESLVEYDPKLGYVIFTHPSIGIAHFFCLDSKSRREIRFTVQVYPPYNDSSNPYIEARDSNFNYPIFEEQTAMLNCSAIASKNVGVKSLEWVLPRNVLEKILMENITEIVHENFLTYFRILRIFNSSKRNDGNYTCKLIDENSNTKTFTYFLQVKDSDTVFLNITVPEESRVVAVESEWNSTVEFIATIKSFPKYTFAWYSPQGYPMNKACLYIKCNILVAENGSKIKLSLNNVKLHDFGIYQLKVWNAFLSKTVNFSLIVKVKPEVDVDGSYGRLFRVNTIRDCECIISGYPIPQITWSAKNCQDYPNCGNDTFKNIPSSTHEEKSRLAYQVISKLHFGSNHSMIVQCEANNSLGFSSASFPFLVTDYGNTVTVVIQNNSAPITIGDDVEIRCSVSKYYYENNFEWMYSKSFSRTVQIYQRDQVIPSTEIQIQNSTTDFSYISTLVIKNVQKKHSGKYYCLAVENDTSRQSSFFTPIGNTNLTILDPKPPTVVHSIMKNGVWQVDPGTLVNFIIQVNGNPPPSVIWYKDGKVLSFNNRISVSNNYQNLSIENVSYEDEGVYSFIATNKAGNVTDRQHLSIKASQGNGHLIHIIIGVLIFICVSLTGMLVLYLIWRLYIAKMQLQKVLEEYGLHEQEESEARSLDPNLNIQEQTFFIPYNKKYEFPKNKLELGEELGSGAFGVVRKAVANGILVKGVKTTVAVKMAKRQNDSSCVKALTSELKIMIYLGQHLNVVSLLGACTQDLLEGELAVMVEYCKYGNIRDFILENRKNFVNQINEKDEIDYSIISNCYENLSFFGEPASKKNSSQVEDATIEWCLNSKDVAVNKTTIKTVDLICWSYQCACGMQFLANRKILHGDLAARNVLLAEDNIVKICDFGFAKSVDLDVEYKSSKSVFPIKWLAIESLRDNVFSTQSDVWAFGITMWEFFSLAVSPYPDLKITSTSDLYDTLYSGYRMEKPQFATNKIYNLMVDCWNQNPNLRPSFAELSQELGTLLEDATQPSTESNETDGDERSGKECCKILNSPELDNSGGDQVQHQYVNWSPDVVDNPTNLELTDLSKDRDAS